MGLRAKSRSLPKATQCHAQSGLADYRTCRVLFLSSITERKISMGILMHMSKITPKFSQPVIRKM